MHNWSYENPKFECDAINGDLLVYSPWSGHRNFIYDFIKYYDPGVVVELGSYYGCSAFAILQSIKDYKMPTNFYAIDTWEGDSFAIYGEEKVYESYSEINSALFNGQNSHMLRMTFDEASDRFDDKTIDILHIDGSHAYEDVKHDYLTWKKKVKSTGIVLFHDISADELYGETMGSYVFWEELKKEQPYTCEFDFSFGLGILFFSPNMYEDFRNKVDMQRYQRMNNELAVNYKDVIRQKHFELLAKTKWNLALQQEKEILENDNEKLISELNDVKKKYEQTIAGKDNYICELKKTVNSWKKEVEKIKYDYELTLTGKDQYIAELEQRLAFNK